MGRYQNPSHAEAECPAGRPRVLFVDDEPDMLSSLRRLLVDEPYDCLFATDASAAMEALASHAVQVVVADMRMPGTSGLELLLQVKTHYPEVVRVIFSGQVSSDPTEVSALVRAVHRGDVFKFLAKSPSLGSDICLAIEEALEHFSATANVG